MCHGRTVSGLREIVAGLHGDLPASAISWSDFTLHRRGKEFTNFSWKLLLCNLLNPTLKQIRFYLSFSWPFRIAINIDQKDENIFIHLKYSLFCFLTYSKYCILSTINAFPCCSEFPFYWLQCTFLESGLFSLQVASEFTRPLPGPELIIAQFPQLTRHI